MRYSRFIVIFKDKKEETINTWNKLLKKYINISSNYIEKLTQNRICYNVHIKKVYARYITSKCNVIIERHVKIISFDKSHFKYSLFDDGVMSFIRKSLDESDIYKSLSDIFDLNREILATMYFSHNDIEKNSSA
jgi:hypothetical protein